MSECILAFDIGTSAVKVSLVSKELRILADASEAYQTHTSAPHCAEQNAEDWWNAACRSARALFAAHPDYARNVAVIGVSGHMLGLLAVDAQGEPLAPAMIHADTRAIQQSERVECELGAEYAYRLTGNVLNPAASLCKAMWLYENRLEIYRRSAKFLQSKDYLNFRLTGNLDATDYSDASHAMFLNITSRRYLTDELRAFGLDEQRLPALYASTDVVGYLSEAAARSLGLRSGIPVAAGGGDGACANAGAGIARSGEVYCSLGTTGWIACNMDEPYIDDKRRVFNIISLDGRHMGVFGTVQCVGRAVSWAQDLFAPEGLDKFNQLAAEASAGSDGLCFLPYLEGERSPISDPLASGVLFGIRPIHERRHFARAVFEGVSYALASILNIHREKMPIEEMRIIGGGANSSIWRQILADVGRVRILGVGNSAATATSLGAAVAAGVAAGMFDGIEDAMRHIALTDETLPDSTYAAVYERGMWLYQSLYPLLKPAFREASIIEGSKQ